MWLCTRSYTSARPLGPPRCRTGRPLRTSMSSVCVACLSAPCPPPVLLVGFYLEYPQTMCVCVGCGYQPFLFLSRVPVYRYLSSLERAPAGHQLQWNYNTKHSSSSLLIPPPSPPLSSRSFPSSFLSRYGSCTDETEYQLMSVDPIDSTGIQTIAGMGPKVNDALLRRESVGTTSSIVFITKVFVHRIPTSCMLHRACLTHATHVPHACLTRASHVAPSSSPNISLLGPPLCLAHPPTRPSVLHPKGRHERRRMEFPLRVLLQDGLLGNFAGKVRRQCKGVDGQVRLRHALLYTVSKAGIRGCHTHAPSLSTDD